MHECAWTKLVCAQLPAKVIPYVASKRQPVGIPDRIIWAKEWQGFVEFKNISTPLGTAQKLTMCRLNAIRRGSAFIWRRCVDEQIAVQYCIGGEVHLLALVPVSAVLGFCAEYTDRA